MKTIMIVAGAVFVAVLILWAFALASLIRGFDSDRFARGIGEFGGGVRRGFDCAVRGDCR